MAVFRNYYNRRRHIRWSVTVSCLFLLCSTINCTVTVNGERVRHHHGNKQDQEDVYVSQLEKTAMEDRCPNCLHKTHHQQSTASSKSETDNLRLEAIKRQILSKLGLRQKPNVTHSLPKEVVMQTLYRAEDNRDYFGHENGAGGTANGGQQEDAMLSTTSARSAPAEQMDVDDFYGRTSEIISFAEEGYSVNGNGLLEFRVSPETGQAGQEFTVRAATLWLKADLRRPRTSRCKSTEIYVFKFISSISHSVKLSSQEFSERTSQPITFTLEERNSGWQKIDLTETVRQWLTESSKKESLRLFVDCSCCSNWHVHVFNGGGGGDQDPNRPFLVIYTDPNTAKRVRRRALDCSLNLGNQCCKQRFYVSFEQLGWDDWIIAPNGYYANYCRGDCGHHRTPDTFVTYHTHVIDEFRKTHHLSGMQPCCAPLKFSSMSLIYFGPNNTIIKRDMPKMVVDECGCP